MTISSAVITSTVAKYYKQGLNAPEITQKIYSEAKTNGADCTEQEIRRSVEDSLLMLNRRV
jgi:hypothetical protein